MLLIRLKVFLKSLFFHIWAGFPKATFEEISERYKFVWTVMNLININIYAMYVDVISIIKDSF